LFMSGIYFFDMKDFILEWVAFLIRFQLYSFQPCYFFYSVDYFLHCRSRSSWLVSFWWFQCMLFNQ
jgi:hypothetical protein